MPLTPIAQPFATSTSTPPMISSWYMPLRLVWVSSPPCTMGAPRKTSTGSGVELELRAKMMNSLPSARVWMSCGMTS